MLSKLTVAIDAALKKVHLNKFCYLAEDDQSYYITGCADNGDVIYGGASCKVDKETLECSFCSIYDPNMKKPKRKLKPPADRMDIFMPLE